MNRRTFIRQAMAAAGLCLAQTQSASPAGSTPGVRLGFDTWSLEGFHWKAIQLLDYAARLKLDAIHMDLADYESLDDAYVRTVKDRAARLGIAIDSAIGCVCPTSSNWDPKHGDPAEYLRHGLRVAKAVGSASLRCFMGGGGERRGAVPLERHIGATVEVLRSARSQALDLGVKIAVENHGDVQAGELRNLVEAAGKDFVGVCLDSGNAVAAMEDPLVTLEVLGPYVLTTHIRDSAVFEHPRGAAFQWVALGDGAVDLARFFERFRQICPKVSVQLEILTGAPPHVLPYFEPEFWQAFPNAKASEFARFVALAKKGHAFTGPMMTAGPGPRSPEYQAMLNEQQRRDLERSLEYAKKVLNLGVQWRA